jgi:hypothetical protein
VGVGVRKLLNEEDFRAEAAAVGGGEVGVQRTGDHFFLADVAVAEKDVGKVQVAEMAT